MRNFAIGFALAAAIFAAIGVAYAAIPHSQTGVISSCVSWVTGHVRIIDTESGKQCWPWENELDWNQAGAPGAPGPQGDPGPSWNVYVKSLGVNVNPGTLLGVAIACDVDDHFALSGGFDVAFNATTKLISSGRGFADSWQFEFYNDGASVNGVGISVVCADPTP